jgi:uncharacterized FAD-dependent dehydrogenase
MTEPRTEIIDLIVLLETSESKEGWRQAAAQSLDISPERITGLRLRKHSIDARRRQIKVRLRIEVGLDGAVPEIAILNEPYPVVDDAADRVVIVGSGPAGLFAALRCLERGMKPVVIERGKDVSARRFDLAPIFRKGEIIEDSNYCFGEGGAGTFSDGKLYTRATKRGPVAKVYQTLVAHGAPERILVDAHPHIGSNLLPNVVRALRHSIVGAGGEVHFQTKVVGLELENLRIRGVMTQNGRCFEGEAVILATGHSARDIYRILDEEGIRLEMKPFAVGVRIEHPQALIDSLQYHTLRGSGRPCLLPAASYNLATKIDGRGVHSFCMCPGGFIVPAATKNDEVVVNGMSLSRRDSPFANSGLVVTVEPEDVKNWGHAHGNLGGIKFQKSLEMEAKRSGGGGQRAPAQRLTDFLSGRLSRDLPGTSYRPGLEPARLDALLPPWVVKPMKQGLSHFGRRMPGYITDEAVLLGFETRTSSPVRISRNPETLEHPQVRGLFPCGEGAGFAGGIVSAALDGIRCADAAFESRASGKSTTRLLDLSKGRS